MSFSEFQRSFELAPIILIDGIAKNLPGAGANGGGQISILDLLPPVSGPGLNDYFAHFKVLPGGTLQDWGVAEYPFASMVMAANAVIQNPLKVSLMMTCPAQTGYNNYENKQSAFSILKSSLDNHISRGGSFNVLTPAYTYTNCLLVSLVDVSSMGDKQVQLAYQWNFVQPLLTTSGAITSLNNVYNKLGLQLPTPPVLTNSSVATTVGNSSTNQPPGASQPGAPIPTWNGQ